VTRDRQWLLAVLVGTGLLGVIYIAVMPPGLPYDEPSHWLNVQFYLEHRRMPVIGEPGVTYEAQMGPVAYVVSAIAAAPWWQASHEAAFYAIRTLGLLELIALVTLVWRLTRKALPGQPSAALLAAALLGVNPMLLAMSTSIQNDVLALVLSAAAVDVAASASPWRTRTTVVVGLLVGLALLTKITVWPVALVLGLWMLWRRRYPATLVYGLTTLLVSGWWFVRNLRLYGDLSGQRAVDEAGYDFPALGWQPEQIVREVATYLWIPVEYVRNVVSAPLAVEGAIVVLTVIGLTGAWVSSRQLGPAGRLLWVVAVVAVIGWLVVIVAVQSVAFRFAYVALPAWFVALGGLELRRRWRPVGVAVVLTVLALDVWFLMELLALADPGLLELA
jgi:hypothetical protein